MLIVVGWAREPRDPQALLRRGPAPQLLPRGRRQRGLPVGGEPGHPAARGGGGRGPAGPLAPPAPAHRAGAGVLRQLPHPPAGMGERAGGTGRPAPAGGRPGAPSPNLPPPTSPPYPT